MLLDLNDPKKMGLLSLGLRLMSTPGKFGPALGQAGMGALGDMQALQAQNETRKDRDQARALRALQEQQAQMALTQALQEQQRRQKVEQAYSGAFMSPAQQSMAGGGGPSIENAQAMQGMAPKIDQGKLLEGLMQADPMMAYQLMQPKAPIKMGAGESLLDPQTMKPLYQAPEKDTQPSAVKEYQFAKAQGYPGSFEQWELSRRKAGATSVSVNTGQKGLDNTLKLRGDFRSEPIYKAHQDVISAHSQITAALKQQSPAGDLAGATKIMKILDPGSVVRESELGMAMAATGMLDRAMNYAQMVISGQKLTPNQRRDFQTLADSLARESERHYNAKRAEYEGIASRNQLNVEDVLGPPGTLKQEGTVRRYNPQTGRIE